MRRTTPPHPRRTPHLRRGTPPRAKKCSPKKKNLPKKDGSLRAHHLFTSAHSSLLRLNPLLNLTDCFTISTIYVLSHQQLSHVLTILSDMTCSMTSLWSHVIGVISSLDSFFKDVLASKIHHHFQWIEVFNASSCQQAHICLVKEGVTRFNQDLLIESSFNNAQN